MIDRKTKIKAYGLPRIPHIIFPDKQESRKHGSKSQDAKLWSSTRKFARRRLKKAHRQKVKQQINKEVILYGIT